MEKIVVIGGGFAGIIIAKELAHSKDYSVTLVDRNTYNFFPPLLYQVATGFLEVSNISYPFRKLFTHKENLHFRMGEFLEVVPGENKVILSNGELSYDHLVFATGAGTNYFGMENLKQNALPMKTVNDALELRNHFLLTMEKASVATNAAERTKMLTIVVAGGGPTGVEISGMLAEMKKYIVPKDYPELTGRGYESHIYLVDGGKALLAPMSKESQHDTYEELIKMGVEVKLGLTVTDYDNDIVSLSNGDKIATNTLVWAAGVTATAPKGLPPEHIGRGKRMLVNEFNRLVGMDNIYAVGDTSLQTHEAAWPNGHPQLAQVAIQQARNLVKNFKAIKKGETLSSFSYHDKGTMAIIGRNKAVADLPKPKLHLKGFIAWFIWIFVHLMSLVNYRNKLRTLYNWTGSYFTRDQSLRMIIRP
ncbi:NAD(P)/FAD-dependent oxidoreductase [Flavihumibacter solisilvae]|uniref:NADH:ubiquinone reductase (non-electrogenic) n=1 Tax=Flavihumibacter solisilvae TaxID=1349421 RepID=A0A0C1L2A1_9BACT|nr:NAD(P)/FAD-dependent oxidoreductase [Flavihumibacter solisilvae]KIC94122.1 NADH dehydrogenase [Flavihumibacter solisilvae]